MMMHIKDSLDSIFDKQFNNSWQTSLLKNWNYIIGNLKTKVQIEKINNDSIVLLVSDACWMQELYLLSNLIIDKINSKLDQPRIKTLRFKQSKLKSFNNNIQKTSIMTNPQKKIIKTMSYLELTALKKINDPQLSDALKKFLIKCNNEL